MLHFEDVEDDFCGFFDEERPKVIQEAIDNNTGIVPNEYKGYTKDGALKYHYGLASSLLRLCW